MENSKNFRTNSNFSRNNEGSSSVRLRRRKDPALIGNGNNPVSNNPDFTAVKKRNRHSGDFYQWNYVHHPVGNIVIPVNRFSMFENRLVIDENRMETLDRRIPENDQQDLWKVPLLTRPPISGTGHRVMDYNHRRSCDLSGSTGKLLDNDDIKTDVNRNVTNNLSGDKHKVNSKSAAKKYHKKVGLFFYI